MFHRKGGDRDCFACRVMRSFAFTGLGAALGGYGALLLGSGPPDAVNWALACGLVTGVVAAQRRLR